MPLRDTETGDLAERHYCSATVQFVRHLVGRRFSPERMQFSEKIAYSLCGVLRATQSPLFLQNVRSMPFRGISAAVKTSNIYSSSVILLDFSSERL